MPKSRSGFVVLFAIIGVSTLLITKAATGSSVSLDPENGSKSSNIQVVSNSNASNGKYIKFGVSSQTTSCGKRVSNYSYQVPWGNAIWNQPICNNARHPKSADYTSRFYNWANFNDGTPATKTRDGKIGVNVGIPIPNLEFGPYYDPTGLKSNFSRNVYYASKSTTEARIWAYTQDYGGSNLDTTNPSPYDPIYQLPNTPIPWNPAWITGQGGDNEIVILDDRPGPTQGRIYELSIYWPSSVPALQKPLGCSINTDRLCVASAKVGRDRNGNFIDYRTYEGYIDGRGVGLHMYATLTTPEEVKAGEIRHALGVAIPSTSIGPSCNEQQLGTTAEGYTCGTAVAPATKHEWASATDHAVMAPPELRSIYTQSKLIPEGMLFAIDDASDTYIDQWINTRPDLKSDPIKEKTARVFAQAIIDYGFMIVDTSGNGAGIQTSGAVNPEARQLWASLGIDDPGDYNLLDGFIKQDKLYVVDPPTVKCIDGRIFKYFCRWTEAKY